MLVYFIFLFYFILWIAWNKIKKKKKREREKRRKENLFQLSRKEKRLLLILLKLVNPHHQALKLNSMCFMKRKKKERVRKNHSWEIFNTLFIFMDFWDCNLILFSFIYLLIFFNEKMEEEGKKLILLDIEEQHF